MRTSASRPGRRIRKRTRSAYRICAVGRPSFPHVAVDLSYPLVDLGQPTIDGGLFLKISRCLPVEVPLFSHFLCSSIVHQANGIRMENSLDLMRDLCNSSLEPWEFFP